MSLKRRRLVELEDGVSRALAAIELDVSVRAYDAWLDPESLLAALERSKKPLCVRGLEPLPPASEGFAPPPCDPVWLRLGKGREIRFVPLRSTAAREDQVEAVEVALERLHCCDAPKCERE
jgi:hypothetical protein